MCGGQVRRVVQAERRGWVGRKGPVTAMKMEGTLGG
jgi:hypothetical protein